MGAPRLGGWEGMIFDREIWTAASVMVKRYGDDALLEAAERAD